MISDLSKEQSVRLASVLAKQSTSLRVVDGTALSALVTHTLPINLNVIPDDILAQADLAQAGAARHNVTEVAMHAVALDEVVDHLSDRVTKLTNYVKNVALPGIASITAAVKDSVGRSRPPSFTVVTEVYHTIHNSPSVAELLKPGLSSSMDNSIIKWMDIERTEADLAALIQTGNGLFDQELSDMIATHRTGWLETVYETYFRKNAPLPPPLILKGSAVLDEMLIVYLLTRALMDVPPVGTEVSYPVYKVLLSAFGSQACLRWTRVTKLRDQYRDRNELVILYPGIIANVDQDSLGTIIVSNDVYPRFLKEGGSPELVIGAYLSSKATSASTILAQAEPEMSAYAKHVQMTESAFNRNLTETIKKWATVEISKYIRTMVEEDKNPDISDIELEKATIEYLQAYSGSKLVDNLYMSLRTILGKTVFAHTDTLTLLEAMDACTEKSEDANGVASPRDMAYHAVIELLTKHFVSQLAIAG